MLNILIFPSARRVTALGLAALTLFACIHQQAAHAQLRVVASISPAYSLVASVMGDTNTPSLLLNSNQSPHTYQLKPSEAREISAADVIFWFGPSLERFLDKPLQSLGGDAQVVQLLKTEGLHLLPLRRDHADAHGRTHTSTPDKNGLIDAHVWLDIHNALRLVDHIAKVLQTVDSENANRYQLNAQNTKARLSALDAKISKTLAPLTSRAFMVFHDAFQYFERRYRLNNVGVITQAPEHMTSVRRLRALRRRLATQNVRCVFREPQFNSPLINTLVEDTHVNVAVLDPLGFQHSPDPDSYFTMMERNAQTLKTCLSESRP